MSLSHELIVFISLLVFSVGILFLVFPNAALVLEDKLNATWGAQEITAVRFGFAGEQGVEQMLNRNVLEQRITWDGWSRTHPRLTGVSLCLLAALIGGVTII